MVASPHSSRLIPIAPAVGMFVLIVMAAVFMAMPTAMLEAAVTGSGISALVGAAEPPLGVTARTVLALGFGGMAGAVAWAATFLTIGRRALLIRARPRRAAGVPVVRRADAHPDAPPRRPVFASRDLGTPLMEVAESPRSPSVAAAVEQDREVPRDLEMPLAAFDPEAILPVPREPLRPVEPLARPALASGECVETFETTPITRDLPNAAPAPASPASIETLLERLEQAPRPNRPRAASLEQTLASLRQMATQNG